MLPAASRLRASADFTATVRRGVRAGRPTLVVHARALTSPPQHLMTDPVVQGPRVGFVVSRAVGNAVARNRVKRRLRHLVRERLDELPGGLDLVVRALPAAHTQPERVAADLEAALTSAVGRLDCSGSSAVGPR